MICYKVFHQFGSAIPPTLRLLSLKPISRPFPSKMARRAKHKPQFRKRERAVYQDSPFLKLPGEIRSLIYHQALVKPNQIDLFPANFVEIDNNTQEPSLAQELIRKRRKCRCCDQKPDDSCNYCVWTVRYQMDLQFVRKELATGLLATCKQIFHEAQHIFWHGNTFRFSNDLRWNGVRRFLSTIGPRACSQLQSLELFAPIDGINTIDYLEWPLNYNGVVGNFPKLHMHKFGKDPRGPEYRNYDDDNENIEAVFHLLDQPQTCLSLRFIVPTGQHIKLMQYNIPFHPGISLPFAPYRAPIELPDTCFKEHVLKAKIHWKNSMTLVMEAGAQCRDGIEFFERCAFNGISVVCYPGSSYRANRDSDELTDVTEIRTWTDPNTDLKQYLGISDLLAEHREFSVPGCGGRATKGSGQRSLMRRLKGFGGCRFVERSGFDCTICGKTGIYTNNPGVWGLLRHCGHCFSYSYEWEERKVIEVKRMLRAIRKGQVDGSMVLMRNRFQPPSPLT